MRVSLCRRAFSSSNAPVLDGALGDPKSFQANRKVMQQAVLELRSLLEKNAQVNGIEFNVINYE